MTDKERPVCDCPESCGCYAEGYAAGKDKAFFEMDMALQDDTHAAGCGCQPCQVKRACLRNAMTPGVCGYSNQLLLARLSGLSG